MSDPTPQRSRLPVWVLVLAAAAYAVWIVFLGTLAVLHKLTLR